MLRPGTLVGDRFVIEDRVGRGGMGEIYRATDRASGSSAALKVLHDDGDEHNAARLEREARLLAELSHPAIVRYLDFGEMETGSSYLAIEWLEGEDLAVRLKRQGVTAAETMRMAMRIAGALAVAHEHGIVHRDIKPANLFLVGGDPAQVKVLDFGIARASHEAITLTRTGAAIGTPRYMAPEQARGSRRLDARADVFSLGCVLFECLAGRPAFVGANAAAVLAKIVLEEPPRLRTLRGELPAGLDELIARMMSKHVDERPGDGGSVAAQLTAIGPLDDLVDQVAVEVSTGVSTGEQRLVCLVFGAKAIEGDDWRADSAPVATRRERPAVREAAVDRSLDRPTMTLDVPDALAVYRALSAIVDKHRGRLDVLADGSVVVTLLGEGAATDQAARAARCALAIRGTIPHAPMALAMGRSVVGDRVPFGEIIDRATELARGAGSRIRVDQVAAGLLDVRFALDGDDQGLVLAGERDLGVVERTLLGKPIPCVGRERELGGLAALFEECLAEPTAHIVLVTGAAGVGKSRLRYELIRRIANRAEVWIGRGDPMSAGAPFALLAQALRRAAGIVDDEPAAVRQRKLAARVSRHVGGDDAPRVTEFLGELVGATGNQGSAQLRAAHHDPKLMGDQMLRACEELIAAECEATPLVLVLEDLQWGDLPTIQFVDAIVRRLADRPLLVLALARPDVEQMFPRLWVERGVERVHLGELKKRSAEQLVRSALPDADAALVDRLVERAAGNAFYLEELIRSVAEGYGDRLPETVIAMAQARIESLEPEARHVLRAASVFGQVFWRGGVAALVADTATQVHDWLDELVRRELVTPRRDSRFSDEPELVFRHALVREAAYAMLTDRDRVAGHRLAGEWLEARVTGAADLDALALAEHFLRGDQLRRAIAWYQQAAELALEGNDLASAIERAERAIACVHAVGDTDSDADNALVGTLRQLQADAHAARGEYALALERGDEALDRLAPPASEPLVGSRWLGAAAAVAEAATRRLAHDRVLDLCATLAAVALKPGTERAYAFAVAETMTTLLWHGEPALVDRLFARLATIDRTDPTAGAWIHIAYAWKSLREGDQAESMLCDARAEDCFRAVGDLRHACQQRANVGYGELMLGAFARAETSLREALSTATQLGLHQITTQAQHNLGLALARQGKLDEARTVETAALDAFIAQDNRRLAAAAHNYLALIEVAADNPAAAIEHARHAIEGAADKAGALGNYLGTLAQCYLSANDPNAAYASASRAMFLLEQHGRPEEGELALRLAYAQSLHATGAIDDARRAIAEAAQLVRDAAAKITDETWRASYLAAVPEHAEILALESDLGSGGKRSSP